MLDRNTNQYNFWRVNKFYLLLFLLLTSCSRKINVDYKITFPKDHGIHSKYVVEWWYYNFHLKTEDNQKLTGIVAYFNNHFRIQTLYNADKKSFRYFFQKGKLISSDKDLNLKWILSDTDVFKSINKDEFISEVKNPQLTWNLNFRSTKPVFLIGGNGQVPFTVGSNHYYSFTRLEVDGEMINDGVKTKVKGLAWFDHQWGNFSMDHLWHWFGIRLDNGSDIIFYKAFNMKGKIINKYLSLYYKDGKIVNSQEFELNELKNWSSPDSKITYPVLWNLKCKSPGIELDIETDFINQEIYTPKERVFYEGSIKCKGQFEGIKVSGEGFVEMIPY